MLLKISKAKGFQKEKEAWDNTNFIYNTDFFHF